MELFNHRGNSPVAPRMSKTKTPLDLQQNFERSVKPQAALVLIN